METNYTRKLILEDGTEFYGYAFGGKGDRVSELVFHTSMVAYQEILSDPAYMDQTVVLTYPLIGNYGITTEHFDMKAPFLSGLIVGEYNDIPSNFRSTNTLAEVMEDFDVPGMEGIDTRELVKNIRDKGARRCLLTDHLELTPEEAIEMIRATPIPKNAVERVSCHKRWFSRTTDHKYNVVAVDCGIQLSTVRALNARACNVTVVPYNATAEEVLALKPDALFLSDGPGNPADVLPTVELIRALKGKFPIFGKGLGHELLALAYGAETYKLKFGHRGSNHPVKDLETGRIEIVSQNHGYAVKEESLMGTGLRVTHKNIIDDTVAGIECKEDGAFAVQYLPDTAEGSPEYNKFIRLMRGKKHHA